MKRSIRPFILCILALLMLSGLVSCKDKPEMKMTFFSSASGDCTVITSQGKALVIDCGNGNGTEIAEYLNSENIRVIEALVISDFTDEHFNGASALMAGFDVNKIYVPGYYCEGEKYEAFMESCDRQALDPYKVDGSVAFPVGDASVRIYAALNSIDVEKGDHCLMTRIVCNKRSFLICGDAGEERLKEFAEYDSNKYDLIKMPSHGGWYDSLNLLLENAKPSYAVIVPLEGIESERTKELLDKEGCKLYNVESKSLTLNCNGKKIEFSD